MTNAGVRKGWAAPNISGQKQEIHCRGRTCAHPCKGHFHMSILNTGTLNSPQEEGFADESAMKKDRSR